MKGTTKMKLGIIAGYSPATMSVPIDLIREAEAIGYYVGLDRRGLRLGRRLARRLDPRADHEDPGRHGDHADARPHARR